MSDLILQFRAVFWHLLKLFKKKKNYFLCSLDLVFYGYGHRCKKYHSSCSCYDQLIFNKIFSVFFLSKLHIYVYGFFNIILLSLKHIASLLWLLPWLVLYLRSAKIYYYMQKTQKQLEQQNNSQKNSYTNAIDISLTRICGKVIYKRRGRSCRVIHKRMRRMCRIVRRERSKKLIIP